MRISRIISTPYYVVFLKWGKNLCKINATLGIIKEEAKRISQSARGHSARQIRLRKGNRHIIIGALTAPAASPAAADNSGRALRAFEIAFAVYGKLLLDFMPSEWRQLNTKSLRFVQTVKDTEIKVRTKRPCGRISVMRFIGVIHRSATAAQLIFGSALSEAQRHAGMDGDFARTSRSENGSSALSVGFYRLRRLLFT